VAPSLVRFRARYPAVRVRVELASGLVDLTRDGVDLALRVGRPGGASLIARRLGALTSGFFASPAYLKRRGAPTRPEHLADHEGLWPAPARGRRAFTPGSRPPAPAVSCEDFGLLAELARAGGGVALLPTFLAARDVASGSLVRVLPEVALGDAPLYLVSRPQRPLPPRVAALRAFLIDADLTQRG
jgi:DNA-binding transcriptional LysR family regulator